MIPGIVIFHYYECCLFPSLLETSLTAGPCASGSLLYADKSHTCSSACHQKVHLTGQNFILDPLKSSIDISYDVDISKVVQIYFFLRRRCSGDIYLLCVPNVSPCLTLKKIQHCTFSFLFFIKKPFFSYSI